MLDNRRLIRVAVATASLAAAGVLAYKAEAANYERALVLTNQWVAECGAPKDREYQSYAQAILDHLPATPPVPQMSAYCDRLYKNLRLVNPYLPFAPPETYEQAFAKVVSLQDKWMKECDHLLSDTISAKIAGKTAPETTTQSHYCDLIYQDWQEANRNFETAKHASDELYRMLLEQERQR